MATQLCSKFGGIDPEKLFQYRATFICQYGLRCCIVWPRFFYFFFYCFVKIRATCENFLGKQFTDPLPLAKNCPYAYDSDLGLFSGCTKFSRVFFFRNKPDEDWYWPFEMMYTLAFFLRCLTSLCSSLFDFNFICIFSD